MRPSVHRFDSSITGARGFGQQTPNYPPPPPEAPRKNKNTEGCSNFSLSTPHVKLFNLDRPDRGGNLTPSPKRYTNLLRSISQTKHMGLLRAVPLWYTNRTRDSGEPSPYCHVKPNAGDGREPSPPAWYQAFHNILIIGLGGDLYATAADGNRSSRGWYKGAMSSLDCAIIYICTHDLCNRTERNHQGEQRNITWHSSYDILYLVLLVGSCFGVHCMVVWLTGIQYLHLRVAQRSLTVLLRPSQAMHDIRCACRILLAMFPIVAYRTYISLHV